MGNKKLQVWLPLLFSLVMVLGMLFGYQLNSSGNKKGFFTKKNTTSLQEALDWIRLRYVDPVNLDSLQGGAIQEMMSVLDPHSVYFPPVELKEANEDLAGNFDGIGIEFNIFSDTVNVVYVMPAGPSEEGGLHIGDKILKSDGHSLTDKGMSIAQIKDYIRGKRGSEAVLEVLRDGKVQTMKVTRGSIPTFSMDASYMIDKETGYIKLNKFTETSYEEFMKALEDLQGQGMKKLIYDLRGNGGGYMNEAIDMADEFLSGDKLIVYTEGANSRKKEYPGKRPGLFENGKLLILVDELSASASEVLAGAIQDWDRATIIGRRTFGKGLVQEQYDLSDGSAIRLTVARYYTPLGRSIQRPYEKGKKVYMEELWDRYQNGEALYADSNKVVNGKQYRTPAGRILYGGGGIMPDIFVPIDTATYPAAVSNLLINGHLNNFVYTYYLKNRQQIDRYQSTADFIRNFNGQPMWEEFVIFAKPHAVDLGVITTEQKESLQKRLEAYLARYRWRNTGYYQVLNQDDEMMKRAMEEVTK
jgi:carboxyl-terminal processing protease